MRVCLLIVKFHETIMNFLLNHPTLIITIQNVSIKSRAGWLCSRLAMAFRCVVSFVVNGTRTKC